MNRLPHLDFSQYYLWLTCPAMWYERSVNRREPQRPPGQRDDPLAIGSLVHAGLEVWQKTKTISIPEEVVNEIGPTKEAMDLCHNLIYGYARTYPQENWPLIHCEEPLRFPLLKDTYDGLAKLDAYFYVPQLTTLGELTLSPGWWIHEYKTKDPGIDLGMWMRKWEANMQASFQLLALQNYRTRQPSYQDGESVQGILINILEKPKLYEPKRKCKTCQRQYAFDLWLPTGEGTYGCPVCGNIQKVAKLKSDPVTSEAQFYRMIVQRSPQRLAHDKEQLQTIANQMEAMKAYGVKWHPWTTENCIDPKMNKQCPYFNNHIPDYGLSTLIDPMMVQVQDYLKETL